MSINLALEDQNQNQNKQKHRNLLIESNDFSGIRYDCQMEAPVKPTIHAAFRLIATKLNDTLKMLINTK
jgi:hypothetical protein